MLKQLAIRSGLETLYFSGAHHALRPALGGVGVILTLHHVRPQQKREFAPNRLLEISPEFLESVIVRLRRSGFETVSLDEMHARLTSGRHGRRFVCFTFDDGYRDNLTHAYPILRKHHVPFAIYVPSSFPEGGGDLWWLTLESVVAKQLRIEMTIENQRFAFDCATAPEKQATFDIIYWRLRALESEDELRRIVRDVAKRYGVPASTSGALCMRWQEMRELARDPLVTIGAHTVNHVMLGKCSEQALRDEMQRSAEAIESTLGKHPQHFSFPIGDRSAAGPREFAIARALGFKTAVTTRPGVLFPEHRHFLTALPRISLNGEFQRLRYVEVLTSGAATALWNGFRRVNAA